MNKPIRYTKNHTEITGKKTGNGFYDDMVNDQDSALFESIGDYMKGQSDLDEVCNDPALSDIQETVKGMISDYNKNKSANKENEKFIREIFSDDTSHQSIKDEINFIKQEINNNKLNEITSEWVREWHEKKQSIGINAKREEIRNFITDALENETSPSIEGTHKSSSMKLFVRIASFSAAALIGAFILIRTLFPASNPDTLYNSNYKPFDALSSVTRSLNNNETDIYSTAIISYKSGNYQEAAIELANVIEKNPSSSSPRFFLGLSQLALKNYGQAVKLLADVSAQPGEFTKEAKWYLGLAYLKTDSKEKARECFEYLSKSDGFYKDRAEKILRRL